MSRVFFRLFVQIEKTYYGLFMLYFEFIKSKILTTFLILIEQKCKNFTKRLQIIKNTIQSLRQNFMELSTESLYKEFRSKCKKIKLKEPGLYLHNYFTQNVLMFDLELFCAEDLPSLQIMFSLPFREINIFQKEQSEGTQLIQSFKQKGTKHRKKFYETSWLLQLLTSLSDSLVQNKVNSLRALKFINIPIQVRQIKALCRGIQKSKYLKEISFIKCHLTDQHVQNLQYSISANVSLTSLNLSFNKLTECGGIIGKILLEHGKKKIQIANMYNSKNLDPQFDIANTGISEVNLQGNTINDKSVQDLITFLFNDQWVRLINLKNNQITSVGIQKCIHLISTNSNIVNLDLRQNQGLAKQSSKIIFKKLRQNLQNYKKKQKLFRHQSSLRKKKCHQNDAGPIRANSLTKKQSHNKSKQNSSNFQQPITQFKQFNKQHVKDQIEQKQNYQKAKMRIQVKSANTGSKLYHSQNKSFEEKTDLNRNDKSSIGHRQMTKKVSDYRNMNKTAFQNTSKSDIKRSQHKKQVSQYQDDAYSQCKRCHQMNLRALRAQKTSLELEIQLRKLRHFLSKNIDVSAIVSSSNRLNLQIPPQINAYNINASTSFNKILNSENQDEIVSRMQFLMSELTKIMQTVEHFQNTQNTIEPGFQNVNSFSKTVSLYDKPKQLMEIQQQILQDQSFHLQQFGQKSVSIIQRKRENEQRFPRMHKNQSEK